MTHAKYRRNGHVPPPELYQWHAEVARHFPGLGKPVAMGLALWSLGMIVVGACRPSAVADGWSCRLGQPSFTVRERLRDLYREKAAKAGPYRRQLDVAACRAPWLGWVLEGWAGTQVAVALDATSLRQRFAILVISVLYRGCAVPVAWTVLRAEQKHPWKPEWLALLRGFQGLVPASWTVLVLADRGVYAKWRFEAIQAWGWHPMLRVNSGGTLRPEGWRHWRPFTRRVPAVGDRWQGRGTAFSGRTTRLDCTRLAWWGEGHAEPWLILTDRPPPTPAGTGYAAGSSKASRKPSAAAGHGSTPGWTTPNGRNACGWRSPSPLGGCSRWGAKPKPEPARPRSPPCPDPRPTVGA
jgi:hypothetical protein